MMIKKIFLLTCTAAIITLAPLIDFAQERQVQAERKPLADKILVEKAKRKLHLLSKGKVFKTYKVSLGPNPKGHKVRQGDGRTPEGSYVIDYKNDKSKFHLSLHISYPNREDRQWAKTLGVSPGGDIMIHGLPNGWGGLGKSHLLHDWTEGCIAVTNTEIEEIWGLTPIGTRIEIRP